MENKEELKKYFDSKEYVTKIVGTDEEIDLPLINESRISTLISLITDPVNKPFKEVALLELKKEKGGELLLAAIASPKAKSNRHILVAACWESEINYSKYLSFFILLSLDTDYLVSLEAITVIENMEGPFDTKQVKDAIIKVKAHQKTISSERAILLNDLIVILEGMLLL